VRDKEEDEQKPPLARWVGIVQPASLLTTIGRQRFVVTIRLPEKSPKTASSFMKEVRDTLNARELTAQFVLVDSERVRLQRATASFSTFREAQTCLAVLKESGLPTNEISPELENFGSKRYDPWYESVSKAWWPWLAALRNPPPEMPMMKAKNRLDVGAGGKYAEGADGKLEKKSESDRGDAQRDENEKQKSHDEADRGDAHGDENENGGKKRSKVKPRKVDDQAEGKPRSNKKKVDEGE
jgi:hypothetical protein